MTDNDAHPSKHINRVAASFYGYTMVCAAVRGRGDVAFAVEECTRWRYVARGAGL